jgi:hypothetical protein
MSWTKLYEPFGQEIQVTSGKVYQIVFPEPLKPRDQWTAITCMNEGHRMIQLEQAIVLYHMGRGMSWQQSEKLAAYAKEID